MNLKFASALTAVALLAVFGFETISEPQAQTSPPTPSRAGAAPATGKSDSGKPVVVLDPGHGGTDAGARGPTGLIEKDLTLHYARALQGQLEPLGVVVVLTRDADQNPSFDDRAALANERRADLFLSIHFGTVGAARAVRTFVYRVPGSQTAAPQGEFVAWDQAQAAYLDRSRAFAQLLDAQLQQEAPGSSAGVGEATLRVLRGVACPAIAVEIGSVSVPDAAALAGLEERLAKAFAGAVHQFVPNRSTAIHGGPQSRPEASGLGTGHDGLGAVTPVIPKAK